MDIEEHFDQRTEGLHHLRAEGDVFDEVTVHDVEVQPIGARTFHALRFFGKSSEIRGQQGRRNNHGQRLANWEFGSLGV